MAFVADHCPRLTATPFTPSAIASSTVTCRQAGRQAAGDVSGGAVQAISSLPIAPDHPPALAPAPPALAPVSACRDYMIITLGHQSTLEQELHRMQYRRRAVSQKGVSRLCFATHAIKIRRDGATHEQKQSAGQAAGERVEGGDRGRQGGEAQPGGHRQLEARAGRCRLTCKPMLVASRGDTAMPARGSLCVSQHRSPRSNAQTVSSSGYLLNYKFVDIKIVLGVLA